MTCPDIVDLERFLLRDLDQEKLVEVEQHLTSCSACAGEIQELRSNLDLAPSLRRDMLSPDYNQAIAYEPKTVGSCSIIRKLGQGGMGSVYEAQQDNPNRRVAVKMIRPELVSESLLDRFRHESQVLGRLRHPGIAQIYEAGTHQTPHGAQPYYAMELVNGPSLTRYADERKLSTSQRLDLMAKVCDAVHHAHQRGVIHRDLKPDNILIDESTGTAQPKILDFGVARVVDPEAQATTLHTSVGQIIGTVAYMSPEQATANPSEIDTRSDVYSLGVICFELLSARLPYRLNPKNIAESVRAIVQDEPTMLQTINRSLRGDVTTIVAKALDKDKTRRYQSAAEMAADIRRHLRDEPISAHPPSTIYQLRKFARRNKGLVVGVAAAFVLLVAGVIGTSVGMIRAQRARDLADASADAAKKEASKQQAVTGFLKDMLAAASTRNRTATDQAKGRDITLFEALNAASVRVEAGALKDQPEVEIAVRDTMAATYRDLGETAVAAKHTEEALALARKVYGDRHPAVANSLNSLAVLRHDEQRNEVAEALSRECIEIYSAAFGDDIGLAVALNNLATIVQDRADYAEAERLFRRSIEIRRKVAPEDRQAIAAVLNNLASLLKQEGKFAESEATCREALATLREFRGDEHPDVAFALQNLASVVKEVGKIDEAETLFRQSIAMQRKLMGNDHPKLAGSLNNLAYLLQSKKEYTEAEALYKEAIENFRKNFGEENANYAVLLNNLATFYDALDRLDDAEAMIRRVIEIRRKTLGTDHPDYAHGLHNLAYVLDEKKKPEDAELLYREALAILEKRLGPGHIECAGTHMQLGDCLTALRRFEDAETQLLTAYGIYEKHDIKKTRSALSCVRYLVKLYRAWDKPEDAKKWRALLPATRPSTSNSSSAPATQGSRGS